MAKSKQRMDKLIRYGGAVTGWRELWAVFWSALKSTFSRNWQEADEGKKFTQECCEFLGVKHGILTNSGSSAGLLALSSLELEPKSEVIICAATFPTIFNIILQCNLTPVVVDAEVGTYYPSTTTIEKAITKNTKAIIAIHPLGNPMNMPALMNLVKQHEKQGQKMWVIEDNCDGWGTSIGGRMAGSFGDISITSFHAAHIVSMGIGGGVFTNNKELAQKVRMYRDWGRQADINESKNKKWPQLPKDYNPRFIYEKIGYNFQILELQAAMGRVQLRKIDKIKAKRKRNFDFLYRHFQKYPRHLVLPKWIAGADICWFAFPLTYWGDRGKLLRHLEARGIETRQMFSGDITVHPAYRNSEFRIDGRLSGVFDILRNSFWISCHPALSKKELKRITSAFDEYFQK